MAEDSESQYQIIPKGVTVHDSPEAAKPKPRTTAEAIEAFNNAIESNKKHLERKKQAAEAALSRPTTPSASAKTVNKG